MENKKTMKSFATGAIREDKTGKGRHDLLPFCALNRLAKHMQKSLKDHPERNWESGIPMSSFLDSAIRHLFNYMDGQNDEDHLCSAAWNILCAMWTEEKLPNMQNIPSRQHKNVNLKPCAESLYMCDNLECKCFGLGFTQECSKCEELKVNRD